MSALRYALAAAQATQGDTTGRNEGRFAEVPSLNKVSSIHATGLWSFVKGIMLFL